MSHSEYTENYKLARFIDTDQPTFLGDWNETMDDIDGAIKGVADKETTLGNTVSALILRVDDHDGRIGTLEDAAEELESTVAGHTKSIDKLRTDFDSIASATTTTAGLVKISDSTSGTATDTALSQKGANQIVNGEATTLVRLAHETISLVGNSITKGSVVIDVVHNALTKQLIFRCTTVDTLSANGGGTSSPSMALKLPQAMRPDVTTYLDLTVSVGIAGEGTVLLEVELDIDGTINIDTIVPGAVSEYGLDGYAIYQYGVINA